MKGRISTDSGYLKSCLYCWLYISLTGQGMVLSVILMGAFCFGISDLILGLLFPYGFFWQPRLVMTAILVVPLVGAAFDSVRPNLLSIDEGFEQMLARWGRPSPAAFK